MFCGLKYIEAGELERERERGRGRRERAEGGVLCVVPSTSTSITYHKPTLSQPKTCNRSRGPPIPPRGRVETVPYYLPDSLHGDPSKREPGVRCVEVPIHPSGPELRRPRARVERCVRWGCRHARENTGIYRSVTGVRGRKTLGAPFRHKQNKTKQNKKTLTASSAPSVLLLWGPA